MTYIEKNMSYFEAAPPGHIIAYKNMDNLLKNDKYILKIWCLINVKNFFEVP